MAEIIGIEYEELNQEVRNVRNSVRSLNPLEYGSDIGADQFERLGALHDEVIGLTNMFATVVFEDLNALEGIAAGMVATDGEIARALLGNVAGGEKIDKREGIL